MVFQKNYVVSCEYFLLAFLFGLLVDRPVVGDVINNVHKKFSVWTLVRWDWDGDAYLLYGLGMEIGGRPMNILRITVKISDLLFYCMFYFG